jgi:benzoyl-CoA-dihydrodiol lyase
MARELDDAILSMRTNELDIGTWVLRTEGERRRCSPSTRARAHAAHWLVRETIGLLRRTLARLDVSSRTLFALIEPGSASPGTLSSSRSRPIAATCSRCRTTGARAAHRALGDELRRVSDGDGSRAWPRASTTKRAPLAAARERSGACSPGRAESLGLVTAALDELDWADEIRIALEERASLSPTR